MATHFFLDLNDSSKDDFIRDFIVISKYVSDSKRKDDDLKDLLREAIEIYLQPES